MALIQCAMTGCRFNGQNRCTLPEITVTPGQVAHIPAVLGAASSFYNEQLYAGYSTEFESYVAYAHEHPNDGIAGALCATYDPR